MHDYITHLIRIITLVFVLASSTQVHSRSTSGQDSLLSVINNPVTTDSIRLTALDEMIVSYIPSQQMDSIIYYAKILLDLSRNLKDDQYTTVALNYLAVANKEKRNFREALNYSFQTIEHMLPNEDSTNLARIYYNIFLIFGAMHDYEQALIYNLKAQEHLPPDAPIRDINRILGQKATIYSQMGDYEKAIDLYAERLALAKTDTSVNAYITTIYLLFNSGHTHALAKRWQEALSFYEQSLTLSIENDYPGLQANIRNGITEVYLELGNHEKARLSLTNSKEILEDQNHNHLQLGSYHYLSGRLISKSDPTKAIDHLRKAIYLYDKTHAIRSKIDGLELLADILHNSGKTEEAFSIQKKMNFIKDSIADLDLEQKALALEYRNELGQREKEFLARLEAQSKESSLQLNHYLTIYNGLILLGFIATIFLFWYLKNRHREALLEAQIRKQQQLKLTTLGGIDIKNLAILEAPKLGKINDTDKQILECIHRNPLISNQEIADQVNRSLEGVSSSLRKMYRQYDIPPGKNRKLDLVETLIRLHEHKLAAQN